MKKILWGIFLVGVCLGGAGRVEAQGKSEGVNYFVAGAAGYAALRLPALDKIALLAAHTLERDETGRIVMVDGGAWNIVNPRAGVLASQVFTASYPQAIYSEYRYSRELSALVANDLQAAGFEARIFDAPNPDRSGFILDCLAEAYLWGADLILTLHTDGDAANLAARGTFAIVDDRFPLSADNALAIKAILENLQGLGLPLAARHQSDNVKVLTTLKDYTLAGGLLNTPDVGLNRLSVNVTHNFGTLFHLSVPLNKRAQLRALPVVYLEVGTHTNTLDRQILLTKQKEIAQAIAAGLGTAYRPGKTANPNPVLIASLLPTGRAGEPAYFSTASAPLAATYWSKKARSRAMMVPSLGYKL